MSLLKNGNAIFNRFSTNGILEEMEIKFFENAVWGKVFEHNSKSGTVVFSSIDEVKKCNTQDKYSRIYLLDYFKAVDNKIEFLLKYPDDIPNKYNRWKQTNNPCNEYMSNTRPVTGYEAVHIDWTNNYWGGLERNSSDPATFGSCYLDGSVGHSYWYYAIGPKANYQSGCPGSDRVVKNRIQLWVRLDTLPEENKCRITKNNCLVANDFYEI